MKNYIENIRQSNVKEFVEKAIEQYGSKEKTEEANKVMHVLWQNIVKKRLVNEHTDQTFVDYLIASAMLHNLFFDSKEYYAVVDYEWEKLFVARRKLSPMCEELGISSNAIEAIFTPIEAQLGEDTPSLNNMARPGSPTEWLAQAVWTVKELKLD